ncbi:uncharacterized protein LOC110850709 [Folsomia candida]|uniref:uncharacterized protein LOC110850709 n=1 Tax=Folsomia candida TaxID=158441 RepID=UPI000B905989|nr:uncharacterized protein LOC110850709 [Folsomia candida]
MELNLGTGYTPLSSEISSFIQHFKILDCSCCNKLVGFQHRITGMLFCSTDCIDLTRQEQGQRETVLAKPPAYNEALLEAVDLYKEVNDKSLDSSNLRNCQASGVKKLDVVNHVFEDIPDKVDPLLELEKPKITTTAEETLKLDEQKSVDVVDATAAQKHDLPVAKKYNKEVDEKPFAGSTTKIRSSQASIGGVTQNKTQSEPQYQAESSTATAVAEVKNAAQEPWIKRFMWQNCKFSKNLVDGAIVKSTHIWNINKVQVASALDEEDLFGIQDKVNIHLQQVKKLTRPPILDEMVIGEYNGDYYRGRVTKIKGEMYRVDFVDFGGAREMPYTELYPVSENIMTDPIFSVSIYLFTIPKLAKQIMPGPELVDAMCADMTPFMIDQLIPNRTKYYRAILWLDGGISLNDLVREVVSKCTPDVFAK